MEPEESQATDFSIEGRKKARRMSINNRQLLIAASEGNLKEIDCLINKKGADVNFKDRDGNTPLHWVVETDNSQIAKVLLRKGAMNIVNNNNETPIDLCKRFDNQDILQILKASFESKSEIDQKLSEKQLDRNHSESEIIRQQLHEKVPEEQIERNADLLTRIQQEKRLNPVHGNVYQLKVLMLFLYRGVSRKYAFRLGTEIKEAKKFDDLVFEYYQGNKKVYRLLQAKHKIDESKKITSDSLLSTSDGQYSLIKYFFSYQDSKKEELFKNGTIKDITICTNIDFDKENLNGARIKIEKLNDKDDILSVKGVQKEPVRYKFNTEVAPLLKREIQNHAYNQARFATTPDCSDYEIKDFLNHLVFAVNQPNEAELGDIVKKEIGREFDFITTENIYNKFFVTMLDWLQGKERGLFLFYEEGKEFFEEAKRGIPIWFGVRDPVRLFTGRNKELKDLHNLLQGEGETGSSRIVTVSGLGGIGKSEFTRKYINEYCQYYDNKIVWINAESYQSIVQSFHRLACDKLGISTRNANGEERDVISVVEEVYKYFYTRKCLFVFDNAEKYKSQKDLDDGIDKFLPSVPTNCQVPFILITSRNKKWPQNIKVLSLDAFSEEDAIHFVKKSLNIKNKAEENDIKELAKKLQFFPLALQQAVAYIKMQDENLKNVGSNFTISGYLERCKERTKQLLNFEFPEDSDNDYAKTVFVTWDVTLDAIRQKEDGNIALEILNVLSYFAPDNIPIEIFLNLTIDRERLGSAIEILKQYSMIILEDENLIIHRLVQQVIRFRLEDQNKEKDVLKNALIIFDNENVISKNIEHAISVWSYSSKHSELVIEFYYISDYIANKLINIDRYEEAYLFGLKLSEVLSELLRKIPSDKLETFILTTKHNIACALVKQGKYDKALKIFQEVFDVRKDICKPNDSETLKTRNCMALVFFEQGKFTEALKCYREILNIKRITLGENHLNTLSAKRNVANALLKLGKLDEALQILLEICNIQINLLGEKHSETLSTKNSIATILLDQGKHNESLQMFQEILEIQEKTLQKNHSRILYTKNNIASIFYALRKYDDALKIHQELLEAEKITFGENHPKFLNSRRDIAEILRLKGQYGKALKILEEVFEKQIEIVGSDHPDILITQQSKANVLGDQEKYNEALRLYRDVLIKKQVLLGNDHREVLKIRDGIALRLSILGKQNEAVQYYQKLPQSQKIIVEEDLPDALTTKNKLGFKFLNEKDYDKALKIFQEVFDELESLQPGHSYNLSAKHSIGLVLVSKKKYDEALKIFKEMLDTQESIVGEGHHSTMMTKNSIAGVLLVKERHNEALRILREILKCHNDTLGPRHEETVRIAETIKILTQTSNDHLINVNTNDLEKLERLIKSGLDVNTKDDYDRTILHCAVNNGNINVVNLLLESGADVTLVTRNGNTPLHIATVKQHVEIVKMLLQHVSRDKLKDFVDAKTVSRGTTSLHVAVKNSSFDIVKILLKHGATFDVKNKENKMPIDLSENDNNITVLLKRIADIFKDTKNGEEKVTDELKSLKPDEFASATNTRDSEGHTLLQVAMINKHKTIVTKLLEMLKK